MRSALESLGRLRLQAILLLASVFAIGLLGGTALERVRGARGHISRPGGPSAMGLPPMLREDLRLTDQQDAAIRKILERNRPRTDAVLDQFLPRLRAVTDSVRSEIRGVLTPEQQKIFDRMQPPLPQGPYPAGGPPGGLPGGFPGGLQGGPPGPWREFGGRPPGGLPPGAPGPDGFPDAGRHGRRPPPPREGGRTSGDSS